MPLVRSQNLAGGRAERQSGAASYSFSTKRSALRRTTKPLTKPNAPDAVAAEVFGNDPGPSEGVAPPPWTFGGNDMDNLFMLGDFTSQYGPQGMNTISDMHMTMLTSFASAVSKGTTSFGGNAANGISHFMKTHASAHASKSTINKETDGNGVPQTSGGVSTGYDPKDYYGAGPGGEAVDPLPNIAPPSMDSPMQQAFVDASALTSPSDPMFHADTSKANDGEKVAQVAASPGGTPMEFHAARGAESGPDPGLSQSEGGNHFHAPSESTQGQEMFRKFMSSALGREAFEEWRSSNM